MVAALPLLLSDRPPNLARRAGLGDRFHYFRGASGRRYLFSAVAREELADFRSATVILAKRAPDGRLAAWSIAALDRFGRPTDSRRPWPPIMPIDSFVLVHLLAPTEADRLDVVDDLTTASLPLAA
jgi:hypothetical protein